MATVPLVPLASSSLIAAIGHDSDTNTLALQFHGGKTYHYDNVPAEMFEEMQQAESAGRFFQQRIKPYQGDYPYRAIEDQAEEQ